MPPATPRPHGSAREKGGKTTLTALHFSISGMVFLPLSKIAVRRRLHAGLSCERTTQWRVQQHVNQRGLLPDLNPCVKAAHSDP